MYKILIVEDELIAAEYLKMILEKKGWSVVDIVDNGMDALSSIRKYNPHLVLMDIMIKGAKSGCEVAIDIRNISTCSIVFTTAYADDEMISYAMDAKADGYIIKPYNEREIVATISLLNGKQKNGNTTKISKIVGGFYFNHETNLLYKNGEIIKIGPNGLKLIQTLCDHKNSCVSYEKLYEMLWDDEINLKKLQMVIYRIREICQIDFFENINGIGYQIKIDYSNFIKNE
ncbi:MAG: response regulator [Campylobacteraceae bacterium]|nr:response regulator [Campylobacteraceae bacterium]NBL00259.1 response regulator transcription factor [Erysipelotrichia bacterium]NCD12156.1 response regulator transcription factor [Campylobacterota bacterium]